MNIAENEELMERYHNIQSQEKTEQKKLKLALNDFIKFMTIGTISSFVAIGTLVYGGMSQADMGPIMAIGGVSLAIGLSSFINAIKTTYNVQNLEDLVATFGQERVKIKEESINAGTPLRVGSLSLMDNADIRNRVNLMREKNQQNSVTPKI